MRFYTGCVFLLAVLLISCNEKNAAVIWTDHPEFALYGEYFNAAQDQYKVVVRFFDISTAGPEKSKNYPDIVVGNGLRNASTAAYFRSLDNFFGAKKLSGDIFYPSLLAFGKVDRSQYLLPVSFNTPALIFTKDTEKELSNSSTIDFDEVKNLSKRYNNENRGAYTRMGFSPLWNDDFLFITAVLFGVSFREASVLVWDAAALERSMNFVSDWTSEVNTSNQMVEDFTFKYFFEPPAKLIQSGRILFSYMESSVFFTLSEDSRNNLDFRWIADQNKIPLTEGPVLLGLPQKGKNRKAAEAFVHWFFNVETQRRLLEKSKADRVNETIFGICGGFSALDAVTEQIFPWFYPDLLGHIPPSGLLASPDILPANWNPLKERVVLPYLHDRARAAGTEQVYPLEKRVLDWLLMNR